jgi:hypothetical protein
VIKSTATVEFWLLYRALPREVRNRAKHAYRLWLENPKHPGLRFKKVHATEPIYSARIGIGYRALCLLESGAAKWFWIGKHAEYDYLLKVS